jgi:small subunit ribosomal protein S18
MARKRTPARKPKDTGKPRKKKVSALITEQVDYVDYKDVNLLRRFMSERAKIRSRRVSGNDTQQQREVAKAIKNAREMALLPYTNRVVTQRKSDKGRVRRDRDDDEAPVPKTPPPSGGREGEEDEFDGEDTPVEEEV